MRRIARVACVDAREDCVVRGVDVAVAATGTLVRNLECRMVKHSAQPGGRYPCRVARNASCRVRRGNVIWHVRPIILSRRVVRLVAAVAIRRRIARGVIAADVAVRTRIHHRPDRAGNRGAGRRHVRTLQRETCRSVIKLSVDPKDGVVARRAHGSRKTRGNVVWHTPAYRRCTLPRRLMAAVTVCVCRREVVVVADMAVRAGVHFACRRQLVRARQRPPGRGVIEGGRQKRNRVVAGRAIRRGKRRAR